MDNTISRLNVINKLRDELEELSSPNRAHRLGESQFQKWDLFHKKSALAIESLFGKNSRYLLDWQKIEIPEDPAIEDGEGFITFLRKQRLAKQKMENQLEIMASATASSINQRRKLVAKRKTGKRVFTPLPMPSEIEIQDICRNGEDQIHEFKAAGTDVKKLTKEIAAFANTKLGGLILYGVEDDGTIAGTDQRLQQLDQPLQNSVRNAISPPLIITTTQKDVLGHQIIVIGIPAWNKKDVYQYEGRVYIRIGTNAFIAQPEHTKKLHKGKFIV